VVLRLRDGNLRNNLCNALLRFRNMLKRVVHGTFFVAMQQALIATTSRCVWWD
jgi:hypothetical protein